MAQILARTGWTVDDLSEKADGPAALKELGDQVSASIGAPNCTSTDRPATGLYVGYLAYETDTGRVIRYDGSGWRVVEATRYQTWTPTWRTNGTPLSIGNGQLIGLYQHVGDRCDYRIEVLRGSTTNAGNGNYTWDLPVPAAYFAQPAGTGVVYAGSAVVGHYAIFPDANTVALNGSSNNARLGYATYTWAAGDRILISGSYRTASIA